VLKDNLTPPKPRKLQVALTPGLNLYEVQFQGGGNLPLELRGRYTSNKKAEEAIDTHLKQRKVK